MKKLSRKITDMMADAALEEMGVPGEMESRCSREPHESLEEYLIEVAFAEAADFEEIHKAILREHHDVCIV